MAIAAANGRLGSARIARGLQRGGSQICVFLERLVQGDAQIDAAAAGQDRQANAGRRGRRDGSRGHGAGARESEQRTPGGDEGPPHAAEGQSGR